MTHNMGEVPLLAQPKTVSTLYNFSSLRIYPLKRVGRDCPIGRISSYLRLLRLDVDHLRLDLFCFWQGDGQNTILELGIRLV